MCWFDVELSSKVKKQNKTKQNKTKKQTKQNKTQNNLPPPVPLLTSLPPSPSSSLFSSLFSLFFLSSLFSLFSLVSLLSPLSPLLSFPLSLSLFFFQPYKILRYHNRAVRNVSFHKKYPLWSSCSDDGKVHVFHGSVFPDDYSKDPMIVPLKVNILFINF